MKKEDCKDCAQEYFKLIKVLRQLGFKEIQGGETYETKFNFKLKTGHDVFLNMRLR